jgi:hypothetical protein
MPVVYHRDRPLINSASGYASLSIKSEVMGYLGGTSRPSHQSHHLVVDPPDPVPVSGRGRLVEFLSRGQAGETGEEGEGRGNCDGGAEEKAGETEEGHDVRRGRSGD